VTLNTSPSGGGGAVQSVMRMLVGPTRQYYNAHKKIGNARFNHSKDMTVLYTEINQVCLKNKIKIGEEK